MTRRIVDLAALFAVTAIVLAARDAACCGIGCVLLIAWRAR